MTRKLVALLAFLIIAAIACRASRTNDSENEHVATAVHALTLSDDGDGKGTIGIDLAGFSVSACNVAASAVGMSDTTAGQVAEAAVAALNGTITLHVALQRHGQGAVSSVTMDITPDVAIMVDQASEGAAVTSVELLASAQAAGSAFASGSGELGGTIETTAQGANVDFFETNFALTGTFVTTAAVAATGSVEGGADAASAATVATTTATDVVVMNVDVVVSRDDSSSASRASLVSARVTAVNSACVPIVTATSSSPTSATETAANSTSCTNDSNGEVCTNQSTASVSECSQPTPDAPIECFTSTETASNSATQRPDGSTTNSTSSSAQTCGPIADDGGFVCFLNTQFSTQSCTPIGDGGLTCSSTACTETCTQDTPDASPMDCQQMCQSSDGG